MTIMERGRKGVRYPLHLIPNPEALQGVIKWKQPRTFWSGSHRICWIRCWNSECPDKCTRMADIQELMIYEQRSADL